MNNSEKTILRNQYLGSNAKNYDNAREISDRHKAEVSIIKDYITQVKPKRILDCPCGTMRWIDIYGSFDVFVLGVDLSEDMIEQAKTKIIEKGLENKISFLQSDILENNIILSEEGFDMVLCVRFLNWLPYKNALKVIASLDKYSNSFLLIGCTVVPENVSLVNKIKAKCCLIMDNIKRIKYKSAKRYVHSEKEFESFLETINWKIVEKKITMNNMYAVNYLYLFKRNQ